MQTHPVRLFVAAGLPSPIIRLLEALPRPDVRQLRWTTPDQWHITLRFLGEVNEVTEVVDAVTRTAARFGESKVEAELGPATRWFPGRRVLQVPVAGLDTLAGLVSDLTARWGTDDGPPFSGHVTLARVRGRDAGPADLAGMPFVGRFDVTDLAVFASSLGAGGATYQIVASVPLMMAPGS